jgi:fructose-specific phosphotransferase system IIC component
MTGVSYMIPFVVVGGIFIAMAIAFSPIGPKGPEVTNPFLSRMLDTGVAAFGLMVPILAGFIAYAMADRPGIAPGMIGGALAAKLGAGFLGGLIAGVLAGWIVAQIKKIKVPDVLLPIMPIFVIPILGTAIVAVVMYIIGAPLSTFMNFLTEQLKSLSTGYSVILGIILGAMIAFDMGGPVNKVAYTFGVAMISQGAPEIMGPIGAAICVPPLGMALATWLAPKKYGADERQAGTAAGLMGLIGITEGAIPFAAVDPIRVIPSIMVGSACAGAIGMLFKTVDHAPHGGLIVLPVVDNRIGYIISIAVGITVTALMVNLLKKAVPQDESENQAAD